MKRVPNLRTDDKEQRKAGVGRSPAQWLYFELITIPFQLLPDIHHAFELIVEFARVTENRNIGRVQSVILRVINMYGRLLPGSQITDLAIDLCIGKSGARFDNRPSIRIV